MTNTTYKIISRKGKLLPRPLPSRLKSWACPWSRRPPPAASRCTSRAWSVLAGRLGCVGFQISTSAKIKIKIKTKLKEQCHFGIMICKFENLSDDQRVDPRLAVLYKYKYNTNTNTKTNTPTDSHYTLSGDLWVDPRLAALLMSWREERKAAAWSPDERLKFLDWNLLFILKIKKHQSPWDVISTFQLPKKCRLTWMSHPSAISRIG